MLIDSAEYKVLDEAHIKSPQKNKTHSESIFNKNVITDKIKAEKVDRLS